MISLKKIFSDGMILRQNSENTISGTAEKNAAVKLTLAKNGAEIFSAETAADGNGSWSVTLPPIKGSFEPHTLCAESGGETVGAKDVYFGELFHISGQSNMELPLCRTRDPFSDKNAPAENKFIREFRVPISCNFSKTARSEDFKGGCWKTAEGAALYEMSGAGYYFAADIIERVKVPVGLLNTSAGGAAVESFMPYDMIRKYKIHDEFLEKATEENYIEKTSAADMKREREWITALGNENFGLAPSAEMKSCIIPCFTDEIEGLENFSGRIFFFKETDIPEDFPTENAELILGTIIDSDTAYINGVKVGETGYLYPPRYYPIPDGVLKTGRNVIAVRVEIRGGKGGFVKGRRHCIKSGNRTVELDGEWKYAVSAKAEPLQPSVFFQGLPLALYSDMFAPAMGVNCGAFLWYQGETNCGRAEFYREMFADLIEMYRRERGYEIPVIFVQLCGHEGMGGKDPSQSWAKFRQAQLDCLEISRTAMAVTVDAGEFNDLHPTDKRTVGKRLAKRAGELLYGDPVSFARCTGATAHERDGMTEITLEFDGNVYLKNDCTGAFEVIFSDGVYKCDEFCPNKCGKRIKIACPHTGTPVEVRYAWRNAPSELNLYELTMIPISPFRKAIKQA